MWKEPKTYLKGTDTHFFGGRFVKGTIDFPITAIFPLPRSGLWIHRQEEALVQHNPILGAVGLHCPLWLQSLGTAAIWRQSYGEIYRGTEAVMQCACNPFERQLTYSSCPNTDAQHLRCLPMALRNSELSGKSSYSEEGSPAFPLKK